MINLDYLVSISNMVGRAYLFITLVGLGVWYARGEFSAEDCWAVGFNKANLLCSSCDQLANYHLNIIKDHCLQCCQRDENALPVKRYAQARLEVCTCKFGAYPQIQAFIKSDRPAQFPNLSIKYVRGLDPIIKLMDREGNVQDVLAIDKWNTDSVEEFLRTHLENVDETSDSYRQTNMV